MAIKYDSSNVFTTDRLESLASDPHAAVVKLAGKHLHISVGPKNLGDIEGGIVFYLNKFIYRFHVELDGILLGYGKLSLKSNFGGIFNEDPSIHVDVISDFWVFRPFVGVVLRGMVNKKSASHISCLVHGFLTVACYRPINKTSKDWIETAETEIGRSVKLCVSKSKMDISSIFILADIVLGDCPPKYALSVGEDNDRSKHQMPLTIEEERKPDVSSTKKKKRKKKVCLESLVDEILSAGRKKHMEEERAEKDIKIDKNKKCMMQANNGAIPPSNWANIEIKQEKADEAGMYSFNKKISSKKKKYHGTTESYENFCTMLNYKVCPSESKMKRTACNNFNSSNEVKRKKRKISDDK